MEIICRWDWFGISDLILIGEEQQIRFRLNGSQNAEVLCDMTRPLEMCIRDSSLAGEIDFRVLTGQDIVSSQTG